MATFGHVKKDVIGTKYNRLTLIEYIPYKGWLCRCDCGNEIIVKGYNIFNGHTKSCGCIKNVNIRKANSTHGESKSRLYGIWRAMINRCNNQSHQSYNRYGGRGIKVCPEWSSEFLNFKKWALDNGYSDNLTIDRIDVDGNYEPSNCRWVTWDVQFNNKRNSISITYHGITKSSKEWSNETGISRTTIYRRYHSGLSAEEILKPTNRMKGGM